VINPHRRGVVRVGLLVVLSGLLGELAVTAQDAAGVTVPAGPDLSHLVWRNVGPGGIGGRISDFAVVAVDPDTVYVGTAQSGVWKTVNGGITWEPVFDAQPRQAIGGIAVAATNPNLVWVGTGESSGRNLVSTSWGDGIYKSEDGGKSWRNMGLTKSLHIGRIRIDPRDEDVVFVSVIGPLVHDIEDANEARGLYRTTDGGDTWQKVLSAGPYAGFVDLDFDPRDPDVLYATAWHRQRVDWSWIPTGDDGGVWRSADGGDTWDKLTNGLPAGDMGRIGVSVCRSQPDTVYLNIEGPEGGVYRSDDRGASWEQTNADVRGSQYYAQVRCDPEDAERVYVLSTAFNVSTDGGHTFTNEMAGHPVHVDHHALWIDPDNTDHLLLGNDGGIYVSRDRGESWRFIDNLSITQFYEVGVDLQEPFYWLYGGTQDNNSIGAPSGTRNTVGITNDDWFLTVGGDGFYTRPDPVDPAVVYTESQNGNLTRFDTRTGERKRIKPADPLDCVHADDDNADPESPRCYRWNWSAPVQISSHDHETIYFGANVVFRSTDRGDSWEVISDDLSRQITYDNPMNDYGTIRVIAESPRRPGLLAVGTDDGLVHLSDDGGTDWRRSEALPGVPELALARRLVLSAHDDETVYLVSSAHEYYDFTPYILRSRDFGRSWESIRANLPDGSPLRAFAEHPHQPGLLFAGTEHGVWVSLDDGGSWHPLQSGMPAVAIHDMLVHPTAGDLVVATHGRGLWILDDVGSLAQMTVAGTDASWLAPVRPAYQVHRFNRGRYSRGATYYAAPNPPDGAMIDFGLAAAALEKPEDATEDWQPPHVRLRILDGSGNLVRRLPAETEAGSHRRHWDLRYEPTWRDTESDAQVRSPWVIPGTYVAQLQVGEETFTMPVDVRLDPVLSISAADLQLRHNSLRRWAALAASHRELEAMSDDFAETVAAARQAVEHAELDDEELLTPLHAVHEGVKSLVEDVRDLGRGSLRAAGQMDSAVSRPTADQLAALARSADDLERLVEIANELLETQIPELAAILDAHDVPWTRGRPLR
jgi:photosystem II stability/assembly factor-like uncharacterized protein